MPIEIRELIVRATVSDREESPAARQPAQQPEVRQAERILAQVAELLRKRRER
ncbi:MAG: DUF5908 family protein [Bacteroidia bacterium]|nr:DUF5908 family protein [Bacteroidia bacterium]